MITDITHDPQVALPNRNRHKVSKWQALETLISTMQVNDSASFKISEGVSDGYLRVMVTNLSRKHGFTVKVNRLDARYYLITRVK